MNVFDTAKTEIKEMVDLARYLEHFDRALMTSENFTPTETAWNKRNKSEKRYVWLLKKYT